MPAAAIPPNDEQRVAALRRYGIQDTIGDLRLDGLVDVATVVTGARRAVLNLIDADQEWQAAASGMPAAQVARDNAMCSHAVAEDRRIYVRDARADARFADNPYVNGEIDRIRLYAATPLRDPDGYVLGTLCVMDNEPMTLGPEQLSALERLGEQVVALFELRRRAHLLTDVLAEVDQLAQTDSLTGVPNRRALEFRLNNSHGNLVVLYADLDDFKRVNDTLGHDAGDQVLQQAAERLQAAVRFGDLVARHGGDEFVVVCGRLDDVAAHAMADRLRRDLSQPYDTDAGPVLLGASIGVTHLQPGESGIELLRRADASMYADKMTNKPARAGFTDIAQTARHGAAAARRDVAGTAAVAAARR